MPVRQGRWGQGRGRTTATLVGLATLVAAVGALAGTMALASIGERPFAGSPGAAQGGPSVTAGRSSPSLASPPGLAAGTYRFPVLGKATYNRGHHDYPASDIIAACGSVVVAVTDGVVLEISRTDTYNPVTDDGAKRGGLFISILGQDGVRYYGSHLRFVRAGLERGTTVRAGDPIGEVGESGDAGVCHLHFGISPPCATTGDWWIRRGAVWPWSYLDAWRAGKARSPAPEVLAWQKVHGCPAVAPQA